MTFQKDLIFGKKYENIFAKLTKEKYIQSEGYVHWDIMINNLKYEIKTDKLINKTKNFCIEFSCNNKLSGISISDADYWVFIEIIDYNELLGDNYDYKYNMYVIPKKDLINIIENPKIIKKIKTGTENNKNKFYLINKTYFMDYKVNDYSTQFYIFKQINNKDYTVEELEIMLNNFN